MVLALLYFLTGKIGLMLAVPPGYATMIWPASGIATGMLVVYGWRLWPGILIGSFILNAGVSHALTLTDTDFIKLLASFGIAAGSTLQALLGRFLIGRFVGLPLLLHNGWDVLRLFMVAGPLACLTAATIGISALYLSGVLPAANIAENWLTWWSGDVVGVLVFMPLVVIAPWSTQGTQWRGKNIGSLSLMSVAAIILALGLTFYAWKVVTEKGHRQSLEEFEVLALESQKALLYRMDSYNHALLGGVGFFLGSDEVSRSEWGTYVKAVDIRNSFPGINGIGLIFPMEEEAVPAFVEKMRKEGGEGFEVHPETTDKPYYIISYIDPEALNKAAVGLNIGFEKNRTEAAERARDSGKPAITKSIELVQDEERTPGFLLLHPMYKSHLPLATVEDRRKAFIGWVYAPFVARDFLRNLTGAQGKTLNVRIYDGATEDPSKLIYASEEDKTRRYATYSMRKIIPIMQQEWLIVWESTSAYDQAARIDTPLFILVGGLSFSGLLALFLLISGMHRTETIRWATEEGKLLLPFIIFAIVSGGALHLYESLKHREARYIETLVDEESKKIEQMIAFQVNDKLLSLKRMGQRWDVANGTPQNQWRMDARNLINHIVGLRTVEWADSTYHIRWAEPQDTNEKAIGLNILFDEAREKALKGAAERQAITITPPLDLVQGYKAFIAYYPVMKNGAFDGFMVGIFAIDEFLETVLTGDISERYLISLNYKNKEFFRVGPEDDRLKEGWTRQANVAVYDREWQVTIVPTKEFIEGLTSSLPTVIFIASLLIALLLSITVHHILISRMRSVRLQNSEQRFRSAMENAPIGMAMVDLSGRFMAVNQALSDLLGYTREELLRTDFQTLTHPDDLDEDLGLMSRILLGETHAYQMEKRYYHKNGRLIWALLSVSLVRETEGKPKYYISQIQDVTERREMERMKNEFISLVSHELRTPLTSIRGSLGLIEGTMLADLPEKAVKLISLAHKNVERLILLINDILDLDKLASGQMRFDLKRENLADLIEQSIEANQAYADRFKVRLVLSQPVDPAIFVHTDAGRLAQVMANLLSNAAKYSPEGADVVVTAKLLGAKVRILVVDEGPGIDKAFQAHIFEKFSQADSSITREKGGTGLGLHISKEMMENMNGEIGFYVGESRGTTFWIDVPVDAGPAKEEPAVKSAVPLPAERADAPDKTVVILHVEDDEDFYGLLSAALEGKAQMVNAATFEEARRALQQNVYSLVVLDIGLPGESGLRLLDVVHCLPDGRAPVIILSAWEAPEYVKDKVLACLVKSRVPEKEVVRIIEFYINALSEGNMA